MIPNRADTLRVLRLISEREPVLMLVGDDDGYGTRWTLAGQQVEPAIARYLMVEGFIVETRVTEFGAKVLGLSPAGREFRRDGLAWWNDLNPLQRLKAIFWG